MDEHKVRKRILFVDDGPGRTGSTVSLEYLAEGFKLNDYEVFVLTSKTDRQFKMLLEKNAILLDARKWGIKSFALDIHFTRTLSPFSRPGFLMLAKNMIKFILGIIIVWRAMRETNADLVYANEYVVIQSSLAAFLCGRPSVMHIRSRFLHGAFGIRRTIISHLIPEFNQAVFAITKIEAEQIRPRKKHRKRIKIVGEFIPAIKSESIDVDRCRKMFGFSGTKRIVSMLGGILDIKGTIEFLRAAVLVVQLRRDILFVVAGKSRWEKGDGGRAYFDNCMQIVDSLRESGSIDLLGEIMNPLDLIAASDIVLSPSPQTHFPRPVIEAWGFGKPVIAAKTAHTEDLIADGLNGFLYDAGDHYALARCITQLIDNDELCKKMGREGKLKADTEYNVDKNMQTIIRICENIVKKDKSPVML